MPSMANIVVKKADGTTNFTWTAMSAAPGDGGFAQWRGEGSSPALSGSLRAKTQWNGDKTARRLEASGGVPYVQTVSGVDTATAFIPFRFSADLPTVVPTATSQDAAAVICNAIASALFREMMSTGFSAT